MKYRLYTLLRVALKDFVRNNCPYMAAGIAYFALFSIFPLALAGVSVLGFLYAAPDDQRQLVAIMLKLVPVSADTCGVLSVS